MHVLHPFSISAVMHYHHSYVYACLGVLLYKPNMFTTDNPCKHISKEYVDIVQKLSLYIIVFIVVGYFLHVKPLMFSTCNNNAIIKLYSSST